MTEALDELLKVYRKDHYLPDPGPVLVTLASVVANKLPGNPCWLFLVGPPSSGKTQALQLLTAVKFVHQLGGVSLPGLLTATKSKVGGVRMGGALAELGDFGVLVAKDFSSLLATHHEARDAVLSALREVYDGHFVRSLGSGGGLSAEWAGKAGFIAAVTEAIDQHSETMGVLGERFVTYRMPALDEKARVILGEMAAQNYEAARERQEELAQAGRDFLRGLDLALFSAAMPRPEGEEHHQLAGLVDLACRARTPVVRDYRREVQLVPEAEAPPRMTKATLQLRAGLVAIGCSPQDVRRLTEQVILDSIPKVRRTVLDHLAHVEVTESDVFPSTRVIADAVGLPTTTTSRALEDLAAHGVVKRSHEMDESKHRWWACDEARDLLGGQESITDLAKRLEEPF